MYLTQSVTPLQVACFLKYLSHCKGDSRVFDWCKKNFLTTCIYVPASFLHSVHGRGRNTPKCYIFGEFVLLNCMQFR